MKLSSVLAALIYLVAFVALVMNVINMSTAKQQIAVQSKLITNLQVQYNDLAKTTYQISSIEGQLIDGHNQLVESVNELMARPINLPEPAKSPVKHKVKHKKQLRKKHKRHKAVYHE